MALSRRQFFSDFGRTMIQSVLPSSTGATAAPKRKIESRAWVRPPGALPESEFLKTCTKCTDCLEACPYQSIRRLGPEFGENAGTPAVIPTETPCYLCEDMPCIPVCEPRALILIERREVSMGLAVLDVQACYVAQGQPCDYCVVRCPLKTDAISWNDAGLPEIDADGCSGCGVCVYLCPADALRVV